MGGALPTEDGIGMSGVGFVGKSTSGNGPSERLSVSAAQALLRLDAFRPTITVQPSSTGVNSGNTASFSVTATTLGETTLSYQWQTKRGAGAWTAVSGATASSYTTGILTGPESGDKYRCLVTNEFGITTSSEATLTVTVAMPSSNVLGVWYASDYNSTWKTIPNATTVGTTPIQPVVTRYPRGLFTTASRVPGSSNGWLSGGFDNMTVTEKYAVNAEGLQVGTRIVFATTANGLRYRNTLSLPAGTYTMVIHAKSNTGSSQDFLMSANGGSTTATKTATTSWQQFKHEFTLGSTTTSDLRFMKPVTGASGDFVIDNAFLWSGASASVPAIPTWAGHLTLANSSVESVSCTAGQLALTSAQAGSINLDTIQAGQAFTIYATVKRTATYAAAVSGRFPFLFTPMECTLGAWGTGGGLALGEWDNESFLQGIHSSTTVRATNFSAVFPTGDAPDLYTDGGWHVISMRSNGTEISIWIDDCCYRFTTVATTAAINFFVMCIGGNNGFSRHLMTSLALYAKAHTTVERRTAIDALTFRAAADGITITRPRNLIVGEGDSITQGPATNSYFQKYFANCTGTGLNVINWPSISGSCISSSIAAQANLTVRAPVVIEGTPQDLTGRKAVCTILIGANDLQSFYNNASTFLTALYGVVTSYQDAGYVVGVATVLPKGTAATGYAAHNTLRATVNTQLRADVGTQFDFLIDFAADATMGQDSSPSNLTNWNADGLHPTSAGHTILEPIYRAAVNAVLV